MARSGRSKSGKGIQWRKWDWFLIGGILFGLWAVVNTYLGIIRYGVDQGIYWWFCNLALIGTSWGLLKKDKGWLLGFLSIACFTQVFWIADNLSRLFIGRNIFGLVEFLYRPGMAMDEFILAHYHYFTIPVSLFALYFLGKKRSNSLQLVAIFNPLIFGVSYFAFPAGQNINCIHSPCFSGVAHWAGPVYSIGFWALCFAAHLACAVGFERLYSDVLRTPKRTRRLVKAFAGFAVIACALTLWDTQYRRSLPTLACGKPSETAAFKIGCAYTLEHSPGNLIFAYRLKNKTDASLVCRTRAKTQYNEFVLDDAITLEAGEWKKLDQVLPYPDVSVNVNLTAECRAAGERAIASGKRLNPGFRRFDAR